MSENKNYKVRVTGTFTVDTEYIVSALAKPGAVNNASKMFETQRAEGKISFHSSTGPVYAVEELPDDSCHPMSEYSYAQLSGKCCPFCTSDDVRLSFMVDNYPDVGGFCRGCGKYWNVSYSITGYTKAEGLTDE